MRLVVNGETWELVAGTTVAELVERLGRSARGVAVAVDLEVVPRGCWATTPLVDGARVEVLTAARGG